MAGVFPMSVERVLQVNNLDANMKSNPVWVEQQTVALARLQRYVVPLFWAKLTTGLGDYSEAEVTSGEIAGGMFAYIQVMPLMNLNSIGKGFARRTGIEENSTEILSYNELTQYRNGLEELALSGIREHLSPAGLERLRTVTAKKQARFRCSIIGGDNG